MNLKDGMSLNHILEHVDSRRREFLARLLAGGAACAALPAMTTIALADETPNTGRSRGGKGKGGRGGPTEDSKTLAERMIKEFDKDGDSALNQEELTAAIKAVHERNRSAKGKASSMDAAKGKGGSKGGGKGGGKGKGGRG